MKKLKVVFPNRRLFFPTYEPLKQNHCASKGGFIDSNRVDTVKVIKAEKSTKK